MQKLPRYSLIALWVLLASLTACNVSLAADVTPPPDYRPATAVEPVRSDPVFPLMPPAVSKGQLLYAEKCAPCHGESGLGNGEKSSQLPVLPAKIGLPDVARQSIPAKWYRIVTEGNLDNYMPPFGESLSNQQRWDVVAYVYSLSEPADVLAQGEAIYQTECAACHGAQGKGDGTQAANLTDRPADLSDPAVTFQHSEQSFFDVISQGKGTEMPAYASVLDEVQRWAVAAYLRQLAFVPGEPASQAAAESSTPETASDAYPAANPDATLIPALPVHGMVTGQITNSSNNPLPEGLTVTLMGFDGMQPALTQASVVQPDGTFAFTDIELIDGRVFMASVEIDGATFESDIVHVQAGDESVNLPVRVYATTSDPAGLVIDRMHLIYDFSTPGVVQVVELFIISNPTDRVVTAGQPGQAAVVFPLPAGATNVETDSGGIGDRFLLTESGLGDTLSIPPGSGQHQVLFAYQVPYERKLSLNFAMPLSARAVVVMIPDNGIKLQSQQLVQSDPRTVQGMSFRVYTANDIPAGDKLAMSFSGQARSVTTTGKSTNNNLLIGGGVLAGALAVAGWLVYRRKQSAPNQMGEEEALVEAMSTDDNPDALMDAIAALDDLHASGELSDEVYQQRRSELKDRLRSALLE